MREAISAKCVARLGTVAVDIEAGVSRRWSELSSGYVGVSYGALGTVLRVRGARAGHSLEVPVMLSSNAEDWRALLLGVTVPPMLNLALTWCVAAAAAAASVFCALFGCIYFLVCALKFIARPIRH